MNEKLKEALRKYSEVLHELHSKYTKGIVTYSEMETQRGVAFENAKNEMFNAVWQNVDKLI